MGTKDSVKRSTCERDRSMSGRGRVALVRCDSYDSQQVERFIAGENPDGTVRYGYGTEEQYGHDFKKG